MKLIDKVFGTHSQREIKLITPLVDEIEGLEQEYRALTDEQLQAKTPEFRERLENGETLDDLLPEAFATVREAAIRVLGQRPYNVQLIGGIILFQGRVAEMKTGEGKTLVATLPSYLSALGGRGVHIVTVNDYLARRDSEWMGAIHRFLGLTVGLVVHGLTNEERREAYNADITYGTNNELGFDYLRDNMAIYKENMVCRGRAFAIVDEVDSILIDEARTPLIISGQGETSSVMYQQADGFVKRLKKTVVRELDSKQEHDDIEGDYIVDEKAKTATLTPVGIEKAERHFNVENLTEPENATLFHHIQQALKAYGTMKRDVDYVVREGEVVIVDEFTGRLMFGRRYSEGLHQAIEAKEGVKIEHESKTLATITFQNFFRLYDKLSGMTGTALTEAEEFSAIYKLDIIEIPTNVPIARIDHSDAVYKNLAGKTRAIINQVKDCHERGQPVLVGTVSIESSEFLSKLLKREGIKHNVLNAKNHEREAEIVAQAGAPGAVTIATNMAGRGTDIKLGGAGALPGSEEPAPAGNLAMDAEKVKEAGGLFILGTERHESRRIDNQLRGRAGRQGDPGSSRFFISLEDDLMRLFGTSRIEGMLDRLGLDEDTPIDQKMLSNAIENAQKRVESKNFQTRKHVLQYDDVMNKQREIIYTQRYKVLEGGDLREQIVSMITGNINRAVDASFGESKYAREPAQIEALIDQFAGVFLKPREIRYSKEELDELTGDDVRERLTARAMEVYEQRERELGEKVMRELERVVLLNAVDTHWTDHIDAMHELRQGIGLRAYAQTDPVKEYTREGFDMFDSMTQAIREMTVRMVYTVRVRGADAPQRRQVARVTGESAGGDGTPVKRQPVKKAVKVGRNDPCPCGSGKKYKKCCGFEAMNN
ncbi:MAG: preprotein translocase subunit SecA [Oscillospiraceae bacterium]|nr:preprotein translocase subunit SecA [Oscillospiraceae bacterium]